MAGLDLSLVRDDLPFRIQRRLHLIPDRGLGAGRRAILYGLVAWLPIAVWAWLSNRFAGNGAAEPFIQHFSIHARCLVAIPLFVLTEATVQRAGADLLSRLHSYGLVPDAERPHLDGIVQQIAGLRRRAIPWIVVVAAVVAWTVAGPTLEHSHEIRFAVDGDAGAAHLPFGAWWFMYIVRPIFVALILAWIWRLALWTFALYRIARLELALVPTHADRMFGLGFVARTPLAFWPFVLGLSVVLASTWAHNVVYHGADERAFILPLATFAVCVTLLMLAPLLVFAPVLALARKRSLADYGALVARHGRSVRERWIEGRTPDDVALLDAPEIGPVADTIALYEAVMRTRVVPIGTVTFAAIFIPIALPMIAIAALQVPLGEMVLKLIKALV